MALLTLQKGSANNLDSVAIKDGQLLVTTDKKNIYLDNGTARLHLTSDYLTGWADTRNNTTIPNDYNGIFKVQGIKTNTVTNLGINYATLIGFRGWTDSSGGNAFEFAFTSDGFIRYRKGATDTWSDWYKVYTANDKPTYSDVGAPSTTGTNASGTWGISISGNAATATIWQNARTLTIGNKAQSVNGSGNVTWALHDILYNSTVIGTATSWDITTPGVYPVGSNATFTGTGNPESANGGLNPYRYGQLIVSRANTYGIAEFYVSHQDSSNSSYGIKYRTGWNSAYVSTWNTLLDSTNYTNYTVTKTGSGASGTWGISISGNAATASSIAWGNITGKPSTYTPSSHTHNNIVSSGTMTAISGTDKWPAGFTVGNIYTSGYPFSYGSTWMYQGTFGAELIFNGVGGDAGAGTGHMYFRTRSDWATSTWGDWKKLWCTGDSVTGAVWNDYAEFRESDCQEFGRVLTENGDDTLSVSTERLQPFAGVSSDTWGFCQGETEKAKMPIAVAGRVLVYPYRDRNEYKPGDVVCAAPNGTVDIMTPQEEMMYPSRIVGTVSCVPNYEEWGSGDREPAKVNGRIWIKVK